MNSEIISNEEKLKQVKSKVDFDNLKSDFFLKKVFLSIKVNKSLKIIKYNKNLQKRLKLSINDYKYYAQFRSSIEIEIKLVANNDYKFINIPQKKAKYYHIYFDDSKKEIKRNYLKKDDKVNTIKIIIDYQVKEFGQLFEGCKHISSIFFKKFHRINITDMSYMFNDCSLLEELNLSNFNTNNVTDMNSMFFRCSSLNELNLSNFNTNNVKDMRRMFYGCSSLKELNVSNFDTSNVINMKRMFYNCSSLKELNLSSFNTKNVVDMSFMFYGCSSLKDLNVSNFDTNNVTDMRSIFDGCSDELKNKIEEQNK